MKLKTSDMAICAEVSQSNIREYSDQGLLGPVPRSKSSNYRSFDPRQIPHLDLIKTLKEMGYSPQQLRKYGKERNPDLAHDLFRRCCAQLEDEIQSLQEKYDMLQGFLSLIDEGKASSPNTIEVRKLEARALRFSSLESFGGKAKPLDLLHRAHEKIRQNGNPGCPLGYSYRDFFDCLEKPERPARLVSFDPQGPDIRPAGEYLVGAAACYYDESSGLLRRMFDYALHADLEFCGPAYTLYLLDAPSVVGPKEHMMQVAVQVKQAHA